MNYLFNIDQTNNVILYPAITKAFPEFSVLTQDELLLVIFVYDIYSPFRQFPEQERIYRACVRIWGDNNPKFIASNKFKVAVDTYKSLQYNPKVELAKAYQTKIDSITELLQAETAETKIKNYLSIIKQLKVSIAELENEILETIVQEGQLKAGAELSWLEDLMSNRVQYNAKYKDAKPTK